MHNQMYEKTYRLCKHAIKLQTQNAAHKSRHVFSDISETKVQYRETKLETSLRFQVSVRLKWIIKLNVEIDNQISRIQLTEVEN